MTPGTPPSRLLRFLKEARRRRVYTTAAAYAVVSLGVIQGGQSLFDALLFPEWTGRALTILMLLAFPVVLVLAWTFDIAPEGMHRTQAVQAPSTEVTPEPQTAAAPGLGKRRLPFRAPTTRPRPVAPPAHSGSRPNPSGSAGDAAGETPPPDPERVRRAALAHVRHELKTPVGAIIGYSEMLLEDAEESGEEEETRSDLRRIGRAGKELLALIEEILHPDRVDVQGKNLDEFSARVRADLRTPVNAVIGYAEMLIESARESGRERSVPDLERIRTAAHRLLELSNDIVQVATAARATSEAPTLAPTSAIARGVLAKIRPARGQTADDRQGSLLIVDDNEHNRDLLSRQLARMGYLVASVASGRAALQRIEEQAFDLVLLDIIMPEMDGIEVLRRMRSAPRGQDLPVIMISSLDDIDGAIRCLELGAQDYLTKPFHPTLLDARIGACLEARRMREREAYYRTELEKGDDMIERLLLSAFPAPIAARIQAGESGIVDSALEATVLCCDLGRAIGGVHVAAGERLRRTQALLAVIEPEARREGLETVVLEGTRLLLAAGVAMPVEDHTQRAARAALNALAALRGGNGSEFAHVRFGLHTGPAAGGVIDGEHMAFSIWGDAVDLAGRLEAQAEPGTVHVSPAAYALLKDRFQMRSGGVVDVPGRGQMRTFTLSERGPAGVVTT